MLDSLVRVSRRVDKRYFVKVFLNYNYIIKISYEIKLIYFYYNHKKSLTCIKILNYYFFCIKNNNKILL